MTMLQRCYNNPRHTRTRAAPAARRAHRSGRRGNLPPLKAAAGCVGELCEDPWGQDEDVANGEDVDIYRDTALRYAGYANEVGEAFAVFLPPFGVPLSYAVAITYVCFDSVDKGKRAQKKEFEFTQVDDDGSPALAFGSAAADAMVWQLLASVAVPGSVIHTTVAATSHLIHDTDVGSAAHATVLAQVGQDLAPALDVAEAWTPTLVGLAVIPMIVHPIDEAIHKLLNVSLRPAIRDVATLQLGDAAGAVVRAMLMASGNDDTQQDVLEDEQLLGVTVDSNDEFDVTIEPAKDVATWTTRAAILVCGASAPFGLFAISDAVFGTVH